MSIEVTVTGYDRPYIFGTLLSRDEAYDNIIKHAVKKELMWAMQKHSSAAAAAAQTAAFYAEHQALDRKDSGGSGGGGDDSLSMASQPATPRASPARVRMSDIVSKDEDTESIGGAR